MATQTKVIVLDYDDRDDKSRTLARQVLQDLNLCAQTSRRELIILGGESGENELGGEGKGGRGGRAERLKLKNDPDKKVLSNPDYDSLSFSETNDSSKSSV